jgi:hypothetical protein
MVRAWLLLASLASACGGGDGDGGADGGGGGDGDGGGGTIDAASGGDAGPPVAITVTTFIDENQVNVAWVGYQAGDGPWQGATGAGGVYQFTVPEGRYGVAVVCVDFPSANLNARLVQATTQELTSLVHRCRDESLILHVTGTFTGVTGGWSGRVGIARDAEMGTTAYALSIRGRGKDVVFSRQDGGWLIDRIFVLRDQVVEEDDVFDVNFGAQGVAPATVKVALTGIADETDIAIKPYLVTKNGTTFQLRNLAAATGDFRALPAPDQDAADVHHVDAHAGLRYAHWYFKAPPASDATTSLALPAPLGTATFTSLGATPYHRFSVAIDAYAGAQLYLARYYSWEVVLSAGWAGQGDVSYAFPDFTGAAGWKKQWQPLSSTGIASAWTSNRAFADVLASMNPPGTPIPAAADGLTATAAYSALP